MTAAAPAAQHAPAAGAHPEKKSWMGRLGDVLIGLIALVVFIFVFRALFPVFSDGVTGVIKDFGTAFMDWGKELMVTSLKFGILNKGFLAMAIAVLMSLAGILFTFVVGIVLRSAFMKWKAEREAAAHPPAHPAPAAPEPAAGGGAAPAGNGGGNAGGGRRGGRGGGGGQPAAAASGANP